ncbi:MAG: hypothetical protein AB9872_16040 [Solidesulfovibrio sp.]
MEVQTQYLTRLLFIGDKNGMDKQGRDLLHIGDLFDSIDDQLSDLEKARGQV